MKYIIYIYTFLFIALTNSALGQIEGDATGSKDIKTVVGAIGGTVDVTTLGGASYTIPIKVPDGINGMQPSMSITYNSQSGNGILGWGWSLDGVSAITRVGQTIYHDGRIKGVNFDDDRFALNGQRLLLVNNVGYGADSAEYRTEVDGMTKIVSYSADTVNGPARFKVWLPNGNIAYYGYKANTRIGLFQHNDVCMWMLDSVVDRNGNYVAYRYKKGNTGCRLDRILYTGNAQSNIHPNYVVEFCYADRFDEEISFIGNNAFRQNKILTAINVLDNTAVKWILWKYDFGYDLDVGLSTPETYNRLVTINFTCNGYKYNPTRINWGEAITNNDYHHTSTQIFIDDNFNANDSLGFCRLGGVKFTGDFNGDGYTDVIGKGSPHESGKLHVFLNKGVPNTNRVRFTDYVCFDRDPYLDWIYVGDFDGDGMDDFMCVNREPGLFFDHIVMIPYMTRKYSDGTLHFVECAPLNDGDFLIGKQKELTLVTGDFLGNKRTSFFFQTHKDNRRRHIYIYYNGDFSSNSPFDYYTTDDLNAECIRAADYDGDGITELWYYSANTSDWFGKVVKLTSDYEFEAVNNTVLARNDKVFVGDFNGDGHSDFLSYIGNDLAWRIYLFKEDAFYWQSYDITNIMPIGDPGNQGFSIIGHNDDTYKAVEVADFNGDGKTDIAAIRNAGTSYATLVFLYAPFSTNGCAYQYETNFVGTGIQHWVQQDICVGNFLGKENVSLFSQGKLVSFAPMTDQYTAKDITDGMGNQVGFDYKYMMPNSESPADNDFYRVTHQNHYLGWAGCYVTSLPMKGVTSMTNSNTNIIGIQSRVSFNYCDAVVHNQGRGFLGFECVQEKQSISEGPKTIHKRHFSFNPAGSHRLLLMDYDSCFAVQRDGTDLILAGVEKYFYQKKIHTSNNLIFMPLISSQYSEQFDIYNDGEYLGRNIVKYYYDASLYYTNTVHCTMTIKGTGLSVLDNNVDHAEFRTIVENTYEPENFEQWIVNRPSSTKNTALDLDDSNQPVSSITTFIYGDSNPYNPTRKTTYPGGSINPNDPLATYTTYQYDVAGNVVYTTFGDLSNNLPIKTIEYEYSYDKRRLCKKTNHAGYSTRYWYDEYFGYCRAISDCNGLETTFFKDPMGVCFQTFLPDGTITQLSRSWVTAGDNMKPLNAKYFELKQKSGEADVKVYYDATGRELRTITRGFDGSFVCVDTKYNNSGLVHSVSEPFFYDNLGNEKRTYYKYDIFNRNHKTIAPDETCVETVVDGFTTTTINHPAPNSLASDQVNSATVNSAGWTIESVDANGTAVNYGYYPDGLLKWTQIGNDQTTRVSIEYDNARNRTILKDPNYGIVTSVYNAYGQLVANTDPKGNVTTYYYDNLGRNTERVETNAQTNETESTFWIYDESGNDRLDYITRNNQLIHYEYDALGRLQTVREKRPGSQEMATSYQYDEFSRINTVTYPTGYTVRKMYNGYGHLWKITDSNYLPLWETLEVNEFGQVIEYKLGEDILNRQQFDDAHRLVFSAAKVNEEIIQNFSFDYDDFSNLASRKDEKRNMEERFAYDNLNRLTSVTLGNVESQMVYDDYGRIISKQANGQSVFSAAQYQTYGQGGQLKPHAISSATITSFTPIPSQTQSITYTPFDKVKTITQGTRELIYQYGHDHQRIRMKEKVGSQTIISKEYYGNCEIVDNGTPIPYTYLSGPLGTFAVVKRVANTDQVMFVLKDHLGSWTAITDYDGDLLQELSYDAWGNLRDPATWSGSFNGTPLFDRGFTGHEHLYSFGLINMNGRMYDPTMSSFLSVDNYVQSPDNSQYFNRYAYCLNNPLKYTDPSGEVAIIDDIACAVVLCAISSVIINGFQNTTTHTNFFEGGLRAFWAGAASGLVGGTIGAGMASWIGTEGFLYGSVVGGASGFGGSFTNASLNAWCDGASLGNGLVTGLKAGGWGALGGIVVGGINGGINAMNKGGNFWTGRIDDNVIIEYLAAGKGIRVDTDYNSSIAAKYNDEWLQQKTMDRMKVGVGDNGLTQCTTTLNSNNQAVNYYSFATTGQYLNKEGYLVNGFRCSDMSGGSEMHISPACLYASDMEFDATVGHELIHVYHHYKIRNVSKLYSERVAHEYSYNVYRSNGYYKTASKELLNSIKLGYGPGPYPSNYVIPSGYPFSINYQP